MLIQPDTYIRLIKNCPIDKDYQNTLYFDSVEEQTTYFKTQLNGINYTKQSYQRYANGVIHIQEKADNLYDCNYLMFQNTAFGNKWFYAFITEIEYVNNVSSKIHYEIDSIQTWFWQCDLLECFVEREHTLTDNPGDNIVEENVDMGPYIFSYVGTAEDDERYSGITLTMNDLCFVMAYNPALIDFTNDERLDGFRIDEGFYGGVYQGVRFLCIPATQANAPLIEDIISGVDFASRGGYICSFVMPRMFLPKFASEQESENDGRRYNKRFYYSVDRPNVIDSYVPYNKKLLTYPFMSVRLTSHRGDEKDFAFEYFKNKDRARFAFEGNFCSSPSAMAYPIEYLGEDWYLDGAVTIGSYPLCTWGASGFTEWLNNEAIKDMANVVKTLALALTGVAAASAVGASATSAKFVGAMGTARSISNVGSNATGGVHGGISGDLLIGSPAGRTISCWVKSITYDYARKIDEYFQMYGYAVNRVKIPNIKARSGWTYVKTRECAIRGSAPASEIAKIKKIFNNGIRFWVDTLDFGDYNNINSTL